MRVRTRYGATNDEIIGFGVKKILDGTEIILGLAQGVRVDVVEGDDEEEGGMRGL